MKKIPIIFFLLACSFNQYAQAVNDLDSLNREQKILKEIRESGEIADYYMNIGGKADSVFRRMPLETAVRYLEDDCYAIKYYAFYRILALNDSLAFEYVKAHVTDSTKLDRASACMGSTLAFNRLIGSDYRAVVKYKYAGEGL